MKAPLLLGVMRSNPQLLFSGLAQGLGRGVLGGWPPYPTIDPNIDFTSLALGHRAALDLLAGQIPWWNAFEGVGAPLAGEMQSAALFPLTLLLALRNGQLYEQIALQIIAGLSSYALLRRLAIGRGPAFGGAAAFAFNGVFAWFGNAVVNPVPFLPMLLLGIEALHAGESRRCGVICIAAALALSLYAGFPEVAYLDGLLAAAWTLLRICTAPRPRRLAFAMNVGQAGLIGLLLAAPILIAFADYLPLAEVGLHDGGGAAYARFGASHLATIALPYALGGVAKAPAAAAFWSDVGGYGGCVLLALATAGAWGGRQRALRVLLAAWFVVAIGLSCGAPWLHWIVGVVPGLREAALYRYLPASWIMCLCVLAALALDDLARGGGRVRIAAGVLALCAGLAVVAPMLDPSPIHLPEDRFALWTSLAAISFVIILGALIFARRLSPKIRARAMAAVLACEAMTWFALPTLYYPSRGSIEMGGVRFLQAHLGERRFATLGPIAPNDGSYFGIAEINHNDLPVPRAWVDYIHGHLDPNAHPILFNGAVRADPAGPTALESLLQRAVAYAAIGVRYVVVGADLHLPGLSEVFRDRAVGIYELANPAAYMSAPGCALASTDRTHASASCDAPATLVRLELAMPGWRVWVRGAASHIATTGEIFQAVQLPRGDSDIAFAFEPPFMPWGYALFVGGAIWLAASVACCRPWGAGASSTRRSAGEAFNG